jgi:secreted Zn-dependent insulinase-like peptidase
MAKGVPTDRTERIYQVKYSYSEDTGAAYQALVKRPASRLPPARRQCLHARREPPAAERAVALINEPGLQLYYAPDTEFQRPQTALSVRFVPVRELATVESAALTRLFEACFGDFVTPVAADASLAGVDLGGDLSLEGWKLSLPATATRRSATPTTWRTTSAPSRSRRSASRR